MSKQGRRNRKWDGISRRVPQPAAKRRLSKSSGPLDVAGRYRDCEGNLYQVTGWAKHAVTHKELVVYKKIFNGESGRSWVIPLSKFLEKVSVNGKKIPRFVRV